MKLGKFPELAPGPKAEWGFKPRSVHPKPMFLALASVGTCSPLGKMERPVPTWRDRLITLWLRWTMGPHTLSQAPRCNNQGTVAAVLWGPLFFLFLVLPSEPVIGFRGVFYQKHPSERNLEISPLSRTSKH